MKLANKRPKELNSHLSIIDSTLTLFGNQLPHNRKNEVPQWHRKAALYSLNPIAINVMFIDRVEDNA